MTRFFVLFNLKEGQDIGEYERWAAARDAPAVRSLPSVDAFEVFRIDGTLGGDSPPYGYVEVIDVNDRAQFDADVASSAMQEVAAEFAERADSPSFTFGERIV